MARTAPWAILLLAPPALFLAAFFAVPFWHVASTPTQEAWAWLGTPYVTTRVQVAFRQALLSTALALPPAFALAWLHHRHRIPGARTQLALHALPFVMPVFVVVYGLQAALGRDGLSDRAVGLDAIALLGPLGAVALANAYYNYGVAARLMHAALRRRPTRLEEAAATLGASPWRAAARTSLVLLAPRLAAAATLVLLFSFASFGVVLLLGGNTVGTLETLLYAQLQGADPRPERAAVLALLQLAINVALLALAYALTRTPIPAQAEPANPRPSRAPRWATATSWLATAAALTPLAALLAGSLRPGGRPWGVVAASTNGGGPTLAATADPGWSLAAWRSVFDASDARHLASFDLARAVRLSLEYAGLSTMLAILLTVALAYGSRRLGGWWRRVAEALAALPLGTSSLLIGFGFALAFGAGSWLDLRATQTQIVLAHTLVAFPFVARIVLPAFDAHDTRLDEAARTLGASPVQVARRLHAPLLWHPVAAAGALAAALSLADYGASVVLMRSENRGLSLWIPLHDKPFDAHMHAEALVLCTLVALLAAVCVLAVEALRPKEAGW